jgi:glycosyltransferase involved in cell wall biosynthesis
VTRWAVLTGEYPPQPGGVADYTALVARSLAAAGDAVTVYAPRHTGPDPASPGVTVVRLADHFGPRGLLALDLALDRRPRPDRVLVQYVPHAYGLKAMNLPFAAWVAARAGRAAPVWVMFHEVAFPFRWRPPAHALLGAAHAVMARLVAGAADRVFVSIPGWAPVIRKFCPRARPAEWLPVPSNLPTAARDPVALAVRFPEARGRTVIGHFGTFGLAITDRLEPAAVRLLAGRPDRVLVLLGRGGDGHRDDLRRRHPDVAGRVFATGGLPPAEVADLLAGCNVLVQPYPDGVSTRRTSVMAGLALGRPVVTNLGSLSEPVWAGVPGVALAPGPDPDALASMAEAVLALTPADRDALGGRAAEYYRGHFSLEHTVARLRTDPPARR